MRVWTAERLATLRLLDGNFEFFVFRFSADGPGETFNVRLNRCLSGAVERGVAGKWTGCERSSRPWEGGTAARKCRGIDSGETLGDSQEPVFGRFTGVGGFCLRNDV